MYIALAPMDGITDCAYRTISQKIFNKHNTKDELLLCTEFMSADGYFHNPKGVFHHIIKSNLEKNITVQIFGGNKKNLIFTAKELNDKYNFNAIELNIGCPSPKIMACGGGVEMLKNKKETLQTIKEISESISTPFSIKTRLGIKKEDIQEQLEFIKEASKYCHLIGIHGRTFKQGHSGNVDRDFINQAKKIVNKNCKIIGNGGIISYEDGITKCKNLDGAMIGQASIGNPWILTPLSKPDLNELKETIIEHLELSFAIEVFNKYTWDEKNNICQEFNINDKEKYINIGLNTKDKYRSPVEFRKHLFSYIKGLNKSKDLKINIIKYNDFISVKNEINNYFNNIL
ncbi:tRNA dihydrouridine synthase [Candidatus Vampirococcus lugosii]|uniref:tRNA-dihydrouridine synthase n=1 Tax=Candidatus Vampirococcus lugosii TaxID=2789015 RepID=A0ABS5QM37_9BACT|nr:tRNA-dihydrouridine synthase [Candidatus Vampirococcus lugosii]MBS8121838.1 tRNA dihydrouridine synthase B [Candidatus Vampirococcus lugosii]